MAEAATIARPYAKAAFMFARDAKALPAWSNAFREGAALLADPRVADLLTSPKVSIDQLVTLFAGLGGAGVEASWQNFVRLLATNKRLAVMPDIATQYDELRSDYENQMEVQVTSAIALSDAQQAKIAAAMKARLRREVRVSASLDPSLLGGAVIRAQDLVIDGSIKGRLQRLSFALAN